MPLKIRLAKPSDISGILAVENSCFPKEDRYSKEKMLSRITGETDGAFIRKYYVAEENRNILGYSELAIETPGFALYENTNPVKKVAGYLDKKIGVVISIAVLPTAQGKGIGSLLLAEEEKFLRAEKIRQWFAHAWPNGGFPKLGPKNGFAKIEAWRGGIDYSDGTTAWLFYKELGQPKK